MNPQAFLAGLRHSPDYFLQDLDFVNHRGLVVQVDREVYRQASFLDERMFRPDTQGAWFPLDAVLQTAAGLPARPANYLFHIGHCGSTLLSRLLAELPGCFALREPIAFLALAMAQRGLAAPGAQLAADWWPELFETVTRLQARCYADGDTALIKSTSVAGNLLQPVLSSHSATRAILLYLELEPWLATMLRTPGTRESVRAFAGAWLIDFRRLTGDTSIELAALDDARQAVLGWATMLLGFTLAAGKYPDRTYWLDFDSFLDAPALRFRALADFLRLPMDDGRLESLMHGPIMTRYAKDPHQAFDADVRARELAAARQDFHAEIRTGLAWFEDLSRQIPALSGLGSGTAPA